MRRRLAHGATARRASTSRLALAGAAALAASQLTAATAVAREGWSTVLYPAWTRVIVPLTEAGPLPWTPLLGAAVLVAASFAWSSAHDRVKAWTRLLGIGLLLVASFEFGWGLNAWRAPYLERLGLAQSEASAGRSDEDAARELAGLLVDRIRRDRPTGAWDERAAHHAVARAMAVFAPGVRLPDGPKVLPPFVLGPWGVAGVISPWTLEAHIDGGLPGWARVAAGAHEAAHVAGFASEPGAELVGMLAGLRADEAAARYTAALWAWATLPESARASSPLPAAASEDLAQLRDLRERRWAAGARLAWRAYDAFLRLRGQADGVAGYGSSVRGLTAAHAAGLW